MASEWWCNDRYVLYRVQVCTGCTECTGCTVQYTVDILYSVQCMCRQNERVKVAGNGVLVLNTACMLSYFQF